MLSTAPCAAPMRTATPCTHMNALSAAHTRSILFSSFVREDRVRWLPGEGGKHMHTHTQHNIRIIRLDEDRMSLTGGRKRRTKNTVGCENEPEEKCIRKAWLQPCLQLPRCVCVRWQYNPCTTNKANVCVCVGNTTLPPPPSQMCVCALAIQPSPHHHGKCVCVCVCVCGVCWMHALSCTRALAIVRSSTQQYAAVPEASREGHINLRVYQSWLDESYEYIRVPHQTNECRSFTSCLLLSPTQRI